MTNPLCIHGKEAHAYCEPCAEDARAGRSKGFTRAELPPSKELCEHDWVGDDFCAYCDADAARDMLTDARLELDALRAALGVDYEPHQSLCERMIDAANHKRVERTGHEPSTARAVPLINGSVVDGLEHLLRREADADVEILPDGSVRAAQPPLAEHPDKARMDWLNEQPVHYIELDDFSQIDVKGLDVRAAIDVRRSSSTKGEG